jgi:hypothetical protein
MKMSDDFHDEKEGNINKLIAIVLGIICGLISGFLATKNIDASYIFIAILIATLLSLKIDGLHHVFSLISFTVICFLLGLHSISFVTLSICIISAFIDEIGNDNQYIYKKSQFLKVFFDYRFTMKIAILILAILGTINNLYRFSIPYTDFLSIETFIFFILFEISYELARIIFKNYLN